ncbi:MAG: hypothetical protein ACK4GJ_00255 [bacterium]
MGQNRFTLFITIVLAILTSLLAWNYYKDYSKLKKEEKEKSIFEKKIIKERVNKIVLYNPSKIELERKGSFWFVYPLDDVAYDYMVDNILSNIYQPNVSEVVEFDKSYYDQFFKTVVNLYFLYGGEFYHLQRGVKNDFTNETYLWVDLPDYKDKIYIVNYWDFNYLDKTAEEFRMKRLLNIDQEKVSKLFVNDVIIYKEEEKIKKKGVKEKDKDFQEKKYYWRLADGRLVSKEYINSLFGFLNNYDFKSVLEYHKGKPYLTDKNKICKIVVYSNNENFAIDVFKYNKDEYLVRCSYRKPLFVFSAREVEDFMKKDFEEKKIFSYYIEDFDNFDGLYYSDSRGRFVFRKKDSKWYSPKNEEKTSVINLLFTTLKNKEYKEIYLRNPLSDKYELYTIELIGNKGQKERLYLYNPDYLSYRDRIYKIDPFVFIFKELVR